MTLDVQTEPELVANESGVEPDIIVGCREQLFHLLAEASEIEHALMCSYLYALFSLKPNGDPTLSPEEAKAVARWRTTIRSVAIEEMGHLVLVANLTAAVGGRPHFNRPNFPVTSGYFPSGLTLRLTPFSLETLSHFIYLERPLGMELPDGEGFEAAEALPRAQAYIGLMPGAQDYTTVSHLYEAIRANLTALAMRIGETRLFIGTANAQVGPQVMQMDAVREIRSLSDALSSLDLIIEQGEGASTACEDCHYSRFLTVRDGFQQLCAANPSFRPAYPVVSNPVSRLPEADDERTYISNLEAARLLDFCNATYNLLLRALVQAYCQSRSDAAQKRFFDLAIMLMHVLSTGAQKLCSVPAVIGSGATAGMTFTTLRALEPLATGLAELSFIEERLVQLIEACCGLESAYSDFTSVVETLKSSREAFVRSE